MNINSLKFKNISNKWSCLQTIRNFLNNVILCFVDEKEKYDPTNFRDQIVNGLNEAQKDLEQVMEICLKLLLRSFVLSFSLNS